MPWVRFLFKEKDTVYVRSTEEGEPIFQKGFAEIRYRLDAKTYRAKQNNLSPLKEKSPVFPDPEEKETKEKPVSSNSSSANTVSRKTSSKNSANIGEENPEAIVIYTDGACTGNPGPSGLGVYWKDGAKLKEVSEFLGDGTNNIAELLAIQRALELCPSTDREIILYSDSAYALGLLTKNWKPKANQEIVFTLRRLIQKFPKLSLRKVAAHVGIFGNERADTLARQAVEENT